MASEQYIDEIDKKIILFRTILCAISFIFCFFLMIVYFILILQVKFGLCLKTNKIQDNKSKSDSESLVGSQSSKNKNKKKNSNIGLGSNFMFLLAISNFFGSLFEFTFYFLYTNIISEYSGNLEKNQIKIYHAMNNDNMCIFLGFAHNFFDLFAVCWTTMLTLLFYRSTNLAHEMLYKDVKYLIIGFIYSLVICLIFCGLPIVTNSYGFSRYYCSFKYDDFDNNDNYKKEEFSTLFWRYSFAFISFANNFANFYWLFKTNKYYSKKLKLIKDQNINEYKIMRKFVWIFRIFPIVLIISRIFKGMSRLIKDIFHIHQNSANVMEFFNGFFFASAGIFDSIACIFFFSGVFWCFGNNNNQKDENIQMDKECSDIDLIETDNAVDKI